MKRRDFICCLASLAVPMGSSGLRGQPSSKVFRVGTLSPGTPMTESVYGPALVRGLAQHGYVLGRNLIIETRAAEGRLERIPALIQDLIANRVDVMVVQGYPPALAAKQIGTLPTVVLGGTGDPVATGLIASLARPGGNITGISDVSVQLSPKRLELLKELTPTLKQVAMLWNANDLGMTLRVRESEQAALALNLSVQALGVREPNDFAAAFAAMTHQMPDGILMVSDSLTLLNRRRVFEFSATHRLPAIYEFEALVRDGGLMSYGPDQSGSAERGAALVDRILRGASPADLPFENPTRFTFAINLKTAKSLGITVPSTLLVQADVLIE